MSEEMWLPSASDRDDEEHFRNTFGAGDDDEPTTALDRKEAGYMKQQFARECGDARVAGGIYLVTETSPFGYPLEHFIPCEPIPVDLDELGLTARGVQVREIRGACVACNPHRLAETNIACPYCEGKGWLDVPHVFDVVGKGYYPHVLDFVEETRMLGASRRAELPQEDLRRLRPGSRLVLIHERAWVDNASAYFEAIGESEINRGAYLCPKRIRRHDELTHPPLISAGYPRCARVWHYDLEEGEGVEVVEEREGGLKLVDRQLACGNRYRAFTRPEGVEGEYRHAIFMALPIGKIELVGPAREFDDKLQRLAGAQLPISIEDF